MTDGSKTQARAALFDMDRTLVPVNTGTLYIKWRFSRREARKRDLLQFASWMAQYALGTIDAQRVSEQALAQLAGTLEAKFAEECAEWAERDVAPLISDAARREVERRQRAGDVVAILSASTRYAIAPIARQLGIDHVLCSELHVGADGCFTGAADVCYGANKLRRARKWAATEGVSLERSSFYTDSVSDLPVLMHVGEPRIINPDPRLRVRALLNGWPTESWV